VSDLLSRLSPAPGAKRAERRLGRGPGSRVGKTSARGMKGQKSRKPGNIGKPHFQGGQTPIQRRLPKRGFRVPFPIRTIGINVGQLEERFDDGARVDEAALRAAGLVRRSDVRIKILGDGELGKKLEIVAYRFSSEAQKKIEAAGGKAIVLPGPGAADAASGSDTAE